MMPAEFSVLYDRHAAEVLRAAKDVLRDARLAEEVTQDVFLAFWRGCGYDPARGPAGPYLRRLARNRAVDVWRRNRTVASTTSRFEQAAVVALRAAPVEEPEQAISLAARRTVTREAVNRLPHDQRVALGLTYWGGMTIAEAADHLGIPLGTAKSRVRLALRRLAGDPELAAAA